MRAPVRRGVGDGDYMQAFRVYDALFGCERSAEHDMGWIGPTAVECSTARWTFPAAIASRSVSIRRARRSRCTRRRVEKAAMPLHSDPTTHKSESPQRNLPRAMRGVGPSAALVAVLCALVAPSQASPGLALLSRSANAASTGVPRTIPDAAPVEISATDVNPKVVLQPAAGSHGPLAELTVQIFHGSIEAPQSLALNLGNMSTAPPSRIAVEYDPASQRVPFAPGPPGVIVARARITGIRQIDVPRVEVTIFTSLTQLTSGLRLIHKEAGRAEERTTLTVTKLDASADGSLLTGTTPWQRMFYPRTRF